MYLSVLLVFFASALVVESKLLTNAALYKQAYQSSDYIRNRPVFYPASLGNDGDRNDSFFTGLSCIHTDYQNAAWWMVDLKGSYAIEQIVLTNRRDSSTRMMNFLIDVFQTDYRLSTNFTTIKGDVCYSQLAGLGPGTFTFNCTAPITGRYVRLIRYALNYFHFCELEVMVRDAVSKPATLYSAKNNSTVQGPFVGLFTGWTVLKCAQHCHFNRDSLPCTAFNWVASTEECQFLNLDPRKVILSNTTLTMYAPGVQFFIEFVQL